MSTVRGALEGIGKVKSTHRTEEQNEYAASREAYLKRLQKSLGVSRAEAYKIMEARGGLQPVRSDMADTEDKKKQEEGELTLRELARRQKQRQIALGV